MVSIIKVPTRWGEIEARYPYMTQPTGSSTLAVLFPGRNYPLDAPVMWYSALAAFEAGCDVLGVEYGYQANRTDLDMDEMEHLVGEVLGALGNVVTGQYSKVVFIGKSIGTIVQNEVLQRASFSVRNQIFLTPLRQVIPAIRKSPNALVVIGDRDGAFGSSDVAQISDLDSVQLYVISGADHGLETDDYRVSIDALKTATVLCGDFCKRLL